MIALVAIVNDLYDGLISLILTAADDAYREPHRR